MHRKIKTLHIFLTQFCLWVNFYWTKIWKLIHFELDRKRLKLPIVWMWIYVQYHPFNLKRTDSEQQAPDQQDIRREAKRIRMQILWSIENPKTPEGGSIVSIMIGKKLGLLILSKLLLISFLYLESTTFLFKWISLNEGFYWIFKIKRHSILHFKTKNGLIHVLTKKIEHFIKLMRR